jgi:hypothetical protein
LYNGGIGLDKGMVGIEIIAKTILETFAYRRMQVTDEVTSDEKAKILI